MDIWEEIIAHRIQSHLQTVDGCVILFDQDRLLSPSVSEYLATKGWPVVEFDDCPLAIRIQYERHCRQDFSNNTTVLLFRSDSLELPYDILHDNAILRLSLSDFFPNLATRVLKDLPPVWYAKIFQYATASTNLNEWETAQWVLEQGLNIKLSDSPTWTEYLNLLGEIVRQQRSIPGELQTVLRERLEKSLGIRPIPMTVAEASQFLERVWRVFGEMLIAEPNTFRESLPPDISEAILILESNPGIQNLFTQLRVQGQLPAWKTVHPQQIRVGWLQPNIHYILDEEQFLFQELEYARHHLPNENAIVSEWTTFARKWASIRLSFFTSDTISEELSQSFTSLHQQVESEFNSWIKTNYVKLMSHPYLPEPIMVHHLLPYLAAKFHPGSDSSVALLIVDGMSLDDWIFIREMWQQSEFGWDITERYLFALIPTLTSISRQALLAGNLPLTFSESALRTDREKYLFQKFWKRQGISQDQILFIRNIDGVAKTYDQLDAALETPHIVSGAFITNVIDRLIHRIDEPAGFLAQLRLFEVRRDLLQRLVGLLLERFDHVILTSDHGHVEGIGIGDISSGKVANERALRTRIFTTQAEAALWRRKDVIPWANWGLPQNWTVILPKGLGLFITKGKHGIGHGGVSLEECIIPLITISR